MPNWKSVGTGALSGAATGASLGPWGAAIGGVVGAIPGFFDSGTGTPERYEQRTPRSPEQESLFRQKMAALQGRGAGGPFGDVADYYRDLYSNDSADFEAFAAPEMRRFNERTIPDLAEQFAGMGAGNLSSSGFRNAAVSAGADLSERLGSIRANLRQRGAEGLYNMGQSALGEPYENIYHTAKTGYLDEIAPAVGKAVPAGIEKILDYFKNKDESGKGKSSPYGYDQNTFNQAANSYYQNKKYGIDEF